MYKKQRILFIICGGSVEPLGIMYLSSILKEAGYCVDAYKFIDSKKLYLELRGFSPTIVGFSMTTGQHVRLLQVASLVKTFDKKIKTIAGGAHITYFPDTMHNRNIDYIVKGESDFSFKKLVDDLENNVELTSKDCSDLKLPIDLDLIPFPDRSIIYKYSEYGNNTVRNVMTSRGCPFNCSYCYNSVYREMYKGQKIVRYRSPRNIIDECVDIKNKYKTSMFFFADDEFSMNIKRLVEIKNLYVKEVGLPFHCQIRIDLLDEQKVKLLKEMGCYSLTFAIESGNEEIRKKMLNRDVSNKQILDGVKLLKQYKIRFRVENMIGIPDETFDNVLETLDLNIKVRPIYSWVSLYQPYPNTVLGDYCLEKGYFNCSIDLIKTAFTEDTVLYMDDDYKNKIINLQRLFSIIVAFPILRKCLSFLLWQKQLNFYTYMRNKWKMYCYWNRLFIR